MDPTQESFDTFDRWMLTRLRADLAIPRADYEALWTVLEAFLL